MEEAKKRMAGGGSQAAISLSINENDLKPEVLQKFKGNI
jgi:hypothetical protein